MMIPVPAKEIIPKLLINNTRAIMKFLLTMIYVVVAAFSTAAATVEFDFTTGYEDTEYVIGNIVKDGVTIRMSAGTGSKAPQWFSRGMAVRIFSGNNIEVNANEEIESVKFDFSGPQYVFKMGTSGPRVNPGSYELCEDGVSGVWTVGATKGILVAGGVDAHARVQKITVVTQDPSGVGSIANEDDGVHVENNKIVAPSGAVIYNMNGTEVSGDTEESGLYLVRLKNGRVVKVCK